MTKVIFVIAALSLLSACGSSQNMQDIGSGTNQYKKSPCACGPLIAQPNTRV